MNRFYAERFFSLARLLQQLSFVQPEQTGLFPTDDTKGNLRSLLAEIRADCESVGLRLSIKQVDRLAGALELTTTTLGQLATGLADLQSRIADEIEDSLFVQVPSGKAMLMNDTSLPDALGVALEEALFDLDEAGKCMAFGRNTAAAFHLMRVIELCLSKYGRRLGLEFENHSSWGPVISSIDQALRKYTGTDKDAHAQVLTQFISLKNAWRNPTMHVGRSYDDGQVLGIWLSVRLFIETLQALLADGEAVSPSIWQ